MGKTPAERGFFTGIEEKLLGTNSKLVSIHEALRSVVEFADQCPSISGRFRGRTRREASLNRREYRDILRIQTSFPTPASCEICHLWMDTS